jgi:hypothetical protein
MVLSILLLSLLSANALAAPETEDLRLGAKNFGLSVNRLRRRNKVLKSESCEHVQELWFGGAIQDNFAAVVDQKKWENKGQRYFVNKEFWNKKGPIFVFIGGEGEEQCTRLTDHMWLYDLAKEHNALLVDVEHRYYGKSYPTTDMSTANLEALHNSQQALADLARIITFIKEETAGAEESTVLTFGGSYPGNLAAWFRLKYPSVTHGSVASSAPLTAKANFFEYMEVVSDSLEYFSHSNTCNSAIAEASRQVANLAKQGSGSQGWAQLEKDFGACAPLQTEQDISILMSDLMGNVQGVIQYNAEHEGALDATGLCQQMTNPKWSAYENFKILSASFRDGCEDYSYDATAAFIADPKYDPTNAFRPWLFQTCAEFGYFQTADSKKQPFYAFKKWLALDFSMKMCSSAFDGWSDLPATEWINTVYGATSIEGTNILFPSGTIDPWHALGITNSTGTDSRSESPVYILGTAHCADMYAPSASDPPSLVQARKDIASQVDRWVAHG